MLLPLRAAALVGDRYAVRFLGAAACEAALVDTGMRSVSSALLLAKLRWSATGMRSVSSALLLAKLRWSATGAASQAGTFLGMSESEEASKRR